MAVAAQGAIVASYDFNDQTGADSEGFADGTASAITVGLGLNFITDNSSAAYNYDGGATDQYSLGGTPTVFGYNDPVAARFFADAFAANNYIEFSVTADQGSTIDLGVLNWVTSRGHSTRDLDDWMMVYSTNAAVDFATEALTLAQAVDSGNISGGLYVPLSVDLSLNASLQVGETATFRLYAYGRSATSTGSTGTYFDSFQLQTVPEPSSAALLAGLTGLVFVMVRRRRR